MILEPVKYDFYLTKGEDWSVAFDVLDSTGAVIDLQAATIECQVRDGDDPDATLIFDFGDPGPIEVTVDDEIVLTIPKADSIDFVPSEGVYAVAVTCSSFADERHYVMEGKFYFDGGPV